MKTWEAWGVEPRVKHSIKQHIDRALPRNRLSILLFRRWITHYKINGRVRMNSRMTHVAMHVVYAHACANWLLKLLHCYVIWIFFYQNWMMLCKIKAVQWTRTHAHLFTECSLAWLFNKLYLTWWIFSTVWGEIQLIAKISLYLVGSMIAKQLFLPYQLFLLFSYYFCLFLFWSHTEFSSFRNHGFAWTLRSHFLERSW